VKTIPIDQFVERLRQFAPQEFSDVGTIHRFVQENPVAADSIQRYLLWDAQHYTRNLIDRQRHYELIAICWEPGHVSSIHNHENQNCWMSAPIGRLKVQNYDLLAEDAKQGTCELKESSVEWIEPGKPSAVNPQLPVHRVENPREAKTRAVSLHIYSFPIDKCMVYSLEQHTCGQIDLHYSTKNGVRANLPA
jgi:predicted metal-dependent enzyme (double-stranded beta helix superfamily)